MSEWLADYIIIGSGPSGVQAAQTLTEAGKTVAIIDAGLKTDNTGSSPASFIQTRQTDLQQYKKWVGEDFIATKQTNIRTGSQIAPSRKHINALTDELTPFLSENFFPMESLAEGGLGVGWGLGCCAFSDKELSRAGLPVAEMAKSYQVIADRIGISYTPDDTKPYTMPGIKNIQSGIQVDKNSTHLLRKYELKKNTFNKEGFFLGGPSLALLTSPKDDRPSVNYNEMDFYDDDAAAYRPAITLKQLSSAANFRHITGLLVTHFEETDTGCFVYYTDIKTKESGRFGCRKLILAANILGTSRIILRSARLYNTRLPFLCNHYSYVPSLQWRMLGRTDEQPRTATAQLFLFHDPEKNNEDVAMASLYSYRTLLLFRLLNQVPLGTRDGRILLQYLLPAITIAGIHQPDRKTSGKYIWIEKDDDSFNGIILRASAEIDEEEKRKYKKREALFLKTLKKLGLQPLKKIIPGYGASIHYAGTLPYDNSEKQLTLLPTGRLAMHRNIYVADGSGFAFLPAKGITFSLMANAHRTALNSMKE